MRKLLENNARKLQEIADQVLALLVQPLVLDSCNGSKGSTQSLLDIKISDGESDEYAYTGIPHCVGFDQSSDYARSEPFVKPTCGTIQDWLQEFWGSYTTELEYSRTVDWEGQARVETRITAVIYDGSVVEFTYQKVVRTAITTHVTKAVVGYTSSTFSDEHTFAKEVECSK